MGHDIERTRIAGYFQVLIAVFCVAILMAPQAAQAIENLARPASIVVDAQTGEVLFEHEADSRRYPASVTKVMTLYVLFQELAAGNLELTTRITASQHAANARPTELGLRVGSVLTVEEALLSMIVASANDSARAVAELISGSEGRFAERMTATARALGMNSTTYANASGWPDPRNVTTARDQAILGMAIYQHFPQYYHYFSRKSMTWNGRTYNGHNNVLGFRGVVDGLKTGWTSSSGSTILTSARGTNRHIVLTVLGYSGSQARDTQVRHLVSEYFDQARPGNLWREAVVPRAPLLNGGIRIASQAPTPLGGLPPRRPSEFLVAAATSTGEQRAPVPVADIPIRPGDSALHQVTALASIDDRGTAGEFHDDPLGAWIAETLQLTTQVTAEPPTPVARPADMVDAVITNSSSASSRTSWMIQIGAVDSPDSARALLNQAIAVSDALIDFRSFVQPVVSNGRTLYRARFSGFADRRYAAEACQALAAASIACLAISG